MSIETFRKENLDAVLRELAKEYKKRGGKAMPAEIILIGGAAVLESYGFREMTADIDAVIEAASVMKEAVNAVGDRLHLPNGWLNDDFKKTDSYSERLAEVSVFCRCYAGVLNVRTVSAEYLVAMKLKAGREYKNDLSDVVGILAEHKKKGNALTYAQIDAAMNKLYGGWEAIPAESTAFLQKLLEGGEYESLYEQVRKGEKEAGERLLAFENDYPGVLATESAESILRMLKEKE